MTRSAADLAARLGEAWNPAGTAVTAGAEDDRIVLVPTATRQLMAVVHSVAIALLRDEPDRAVGHLRDRDELGVDFCTLRGTVLWRALVDDPAADPTATTATAALVDTALGVLPADRRDAWRPATAAYRAVPWAGTPRHRLLGATAELLGGLEPEPARGAALTAAAAYTAALRHADDRDRLELATEQSALTIAFLGGDVMVHDGRRIRG